MKTEYVREVLAAVGAGSVTEYPWGFQCLVNDWLLSFHHDFGPPVDGKLYHDTSSVTWITVSINRSASGPYPMRHFRTLGSALKYALAGCVVVPGLPTPVFARFTLTGRKRPALFLAHSGCHSRHLTFEQPDAVGLLVACLSPRDDAGPAPEVGMLRDWLIDNCPDDFFR